MSNPVYFYLCYQMWIHVQSDYCLIFSKSVTLILLYNYVKTSFHNFSTPFLTLYVNYPLKNCFAFSKFSLLTLTKGAGYLVHAAVAPIGSSRNCERNCDIFFIYAEMKIDWNVWRENPLEKETIYFLSSKPISKSLLWKCGHLLESQLSPRSFSHSISKSSFK